MKNLKKCECGANDFYVFESYVYNHAEIVDGELNIGGRADGGYDKLVCSKCDREYAFDDKRIINLQINN